MELSDAAVRVLYNFEYSKHGCNIWIKEGEILLLLNKTNPDWWQVIRHSERKPFFVPSAYVEELIDEKSPKNQSASRCSESNDNTLQRDLISNIKLFRKFPGSDDNENKKCSEVVESTEDQINHATSQETMAGQEKDTNTTRLLHDKRKSWAAEELVTELTQMATARSDPVENDYVNLRVDGHRFVIAPDDDEEGEEDEEEEEDERGESHTTPSLFWHSPEYSKNISLNPMSSSDELDNSDSLGQNSVAWQSKYSLSSEGDKTDESMQSLHSVGNESVSSRHWRDEVLENELRLEASPYAQVICGIASTHTSDVNDQGFGPEILKLSASLEKLAQQIKFPLNESESVENVQPIAPPRQYEAPVYQNIGVHVADVERNKSDDAASPSASPESSEEEVLKSFKERVLQASCVSPVREDPPTVEHGEPPSEFTALQPEQHGTDRSSGHEYEVVEVPKPSDRPSASVTNVGNVERSVNSRNTRSPHGEEFKIEGSVDVKKKIALWNSSAESEDKFDEDSRSRKPSASPKFRTFRGLGVLKSASESRVSSLANRHGAYYPGSRSGSEEFLESNSPVSEGGMHVYSEGPEGDYLDASDSGLSNKSDEAVLSSGGSRRKKSSLVRNRRVESCRRFPRVPGQAAPAAPSARPQSPPPPSPGQEAARLLPAGWAEFRTADGRSFYYQAASGQRRWKPPRRRTRQDSGRSTSPQQGEDDDEEDQEPVPEGWRAVMDSGGHLAYVHPCGRGKWFSSSDDKGRVYFFEENSNESFWNLPDVKSLSEQDHEVKIPHDRNETSPVLASSAITDSNGRTDKGYQDNKTEKLSLRATKSRSMVLVDSCDGNKSSKTPSVPRNWPQLFEGDMCVLKEGPMYRTKITENGKKLRKNWAPAHVVLTELFLLLFRDAKTFAAMKSAASSNASYRPELCVDLNGALIDQVDRGDKASVTSRKNVFLVSTVLGLQVLFQCDCSQQAEEWYNAVHTAIHNLPSGFDSCPRIKVTKEMDRLFSESNSPEQTKKFPRIGRSKSVKIKNKEGSIEDLTVSSAERQTKIRARLKKFFNRRPTMESLVKKGIWKDEPAFGCYLEQVCGNESPRVPLFVQRCITVIEGNVDNMKTDGLYRASGNLSQVQKIRLQVDQNNLSALDQEEDVHVLTGALKLFFRELKEPLLPYAAFNKAIKASTNQNKKEKLAQFRDIVKSLPTANYDTLKFLLKHLLRVTSYQEFNRMHIPNLAIVFGPTLMWPEQESQNMALDLMQQNLVIETFLLDFDNIFR